VKGKKLPLNKIVVDGGTQSRAGLDDATVFEYTEAMLAGDAFEPVVVFYDGKRYWLADGFHRVKAAKEANAKTIEADVRQGTQRDAILYSVGANAKHGKRRTNDDKKRAVEKLLSDPEWSQWSNREIARRCAVDEGTVRRYREEMTAEFPQSTLRQGADGRVIDTANIGGKGEFPSWGSKLDDLKFYACYGSPKLTLFGQAFEDFEAARLAYPDAKIFQGAIIRGWNLQYARSMYFVEATESTPEKTPDEAMADILGEPYEADADQEAPNFNIHVTALYPVDRKFKRIYDHPMGEDEWDELAHKFYPRCEAVSGADVIVEGLVVDQKFSIWSARVAGAGHPPEGQEESEQPDSEEFIDDWSEALYPDKWYAWNNEKKIVWLRPFDTKMDVVRAYPTGHSIGMGKDIIRWRSSVSFRSAWAEYTLEEPKIQRAQPAQPYYPEGTVFVSQQASIYPVDRKNKIIWNYPHSLNGWLGTGREVYPGCTGLYGRAINGKARFVGWRVLPVSAKVEPPAAPAIIVPQKFGVLLVDPPWNYDDQDDSHYGRIDAGDLAAFPVGDLAADDCALFLWTTLPQLFKTDELATAWGFTYSGNGFTWAKVRKGVAADTYRQLNALDSWHHSVGAYMMPNAELCLLFLKGNPKRQNADVRSLIVASVRKHSQKPDDQYSRIERMYAGPYLELFAREKRDGWFAWGDEVESDITFGGIEAKAR
jgi:N6-adenosine-specific RNA methylase IME4